MTLLVVEVERDEDVDCDDDPNCYTKVCNRHSFSSTTGRTILVDTIYFHFL